MKNLKKFFSNMFIYHEPTPEHFFILSEASQSESNSNINNVSPKDETIGNVSIYSSLNVNIDFIKVKYNSLINSDVILREFNLFAQGKQYKALLVFIDGMVETDIINNFILRPLMSKKNSDSKPISSAITNNITVKKVKKFNLENYIYDSLIPQNSIKKVDNFEDFIPSINAGECGLLVDTLDVRICIRCKRICK